MVGLKSQIVAVLTLTSCVILFWRYESSDQIQRTKYCLDNNNIANISSNANFTELERKVSQDINESNKLNATTLQCAISTAANFNNSNVKNTVKNIDTPLRFKSDYNNSTINNNINNGNNFTNNRRRNRSSDNTTTTTTNNNDNKLIVETKSGKLKGKKLTVLGSSIYAFIGIPYAEPPVGQLRFAAPVPVKQWRGIRSACRFTYMCPHQVLRRELVPMNYISERLSEDCLSLNIWTPDVNPKQRKTVMVWIHGGAFNFNTANLHETDGRVLSAFGDIVVVTINYRVGALGFLNSQTPGAPGNMGLYDQILALEWVKANIDNFGGDPNRMVLFGESAGAISIGLLMTNNRTKHLFSRAITQSGGALLPGVMFAQTFANSQKFARLAGCSTRKDSLSKNPHKVVNCLKSAPIERLLKAEGEVLNNSQIAFVPTPDGAFDDIQDIDSQLEDPRLFENMKEILFGVNADEGAWLLHVTDPENYRRHTYPQLTNVDETRAVTVRFSTEKLGLPARVSKIVANALITGPETDTPENNIKTIIRVTGDISITCPAIYMADEFVARNKTVYAYLFDQRAKCNKFGKWQGTSHYEEVPFVFGYPLRRPKLFSRQDIELSKRMMKVWSYFAKTGEILPQLGLNWPKYNKDESYMVLQANQSSIIKSFHEQNCEFFKTWFDTFNKK